MQHAEVGFVRFNVSRGRSQEHKAYFGGVLMSRLPIDFDDWEQVLKAQIPMPRYRPYREAIVKFR